MAVDPARPVETGQFVQEAKRFFPQRITIGHHQLRHLISCPNAGWIYLVDRREIFRFDTISNKRTKITDLPFEARCTATGFGWFCAGAEEHGYFCAMRIEEGADGSNSSLTPDDLAHRNEQAYWDLHYGRTLPRLRVERLGSLIVNSISIHRLELDTPDHVTEIVALLTNNDKSVRMWSLSRDAEIPMCFNKFAFAMNHATISPDGRLLIVVGDEEFSFFYHRVDLDKPAADGSRFEWRHLRSLRLHTPEGKDHSEYFTTAWSPNGSLLAVGSQEGFISVYDVDRLRTHFQDDTPLVVIPSSRPLVMPGHGAGPGAVRTMCFAPEPWDLLLWSEANGRVVISDVRSGLMRRQIVPLDPKDVAVTRCQLTEIPAQNHHTALSMDFMHDDNLQDDLLRLSRDEPPHDDDQARHALTRDVAAAMALERRLGGRPQGDGLTDEEWQRLDMLRTARQRAEFLNRREVIRTYGQRRPARGSAPGGGRTRMDDSTDSSGERRSHLRYSHLPELDSGSSDRQSDSPELTNNMPSIGLMGRVMQATDDLLGLPPLMPVQANDPLNERRAPDAWPQSLAQWRAIPTARNGRAPPQYGSVDAHHILPFPRRSTALRATEDLFAMDMAWPSVTQFGLSTTGVVWDKGRRVVYAGTEEGIFELKMNFEERKVHPSMQMR